MSEAVIGVPAFKTRSGREVAVRPDGSVVFDRALGFVGATVLMDAEEFFRAKRDRELGLWRCAAEPDWVAQEDEADVDGLRTVRLFNERTFEMRHLNSRVTEQTASGEPAVYRVACAFFEAHPEEPLPTEPGVYVRRSLYRGNPGSVRPFVLTADGLWRLGDGSEDERSLVADLHRRGDIVRLSEVGA